MDQKKVRFKKFWSKKNVVQKIKVPKKLRSKKLWGPKIIKPKTFWVKQF